MATTAVSEIPRPRTDLASAAMDDATLIAACRRGDARAMELLYHQYKRRVFGLCHRIVGPVDAEEVVQEVFVRVFRGLAGFRGDALVVPLQALVVREIERKPGVKVDPNAPRDQEGVYLMENGKARFQPISTGMIGELSIEVASGLKGGETLVTGPFKALRELEPGGAVKVEDPKKKKKGADSEKNG